MILSKKSQIGATLTWFVSFIIIFFILIMFIVFATSLGSVKQASSIFTQENKVIDVSQLSDNTQSRDFLISILESRVVFNNTRTRILDLLVSLENNPELKIFLNNELESRLNQSCWEYGFEFEEITLKGVMGFREDSAISKTNLFVPYKNNTLKIKYFRGEC